MTRCTASTVPAWARSPNGRELHLRVERSDGVTLRYDWSFRDGPIELVHHGSNIGEPIPGEVTRVASSHVLP